MPLRPDFIVQSTRSCKDDPASTLIRAWFRAGILNGRSFETEHRAVEAGIGHDEVCTAADNQGEARHALLFLPMRAGTRPHSMPGPEGMPVHQWRNASFLEGAPDAST